MKNLNSIISSHNKSLLEKPKQESRLCNCRNKTNSPLQGKCLKPNIIYHATAKCKEDTKFYIGLSERPFKERYRNHIKDFNNIQYMNSTELTKYVWKLKEENKNCTVNREILKRNYSVPNNGKCRLYLYDRQFIIDSIHNQNLLNKKSDLISKCRHEYKKLLRAVK